jgi:hypothetical protein
VSVRRPSTDAHHSSWVFGVESVKVLHVVGARPNFMKIAPIMEKMARYPERFRQVLVHTGQHYGNGTLLGRDVAGVL